MERAAEEIDFIKIWRRRHEWTAFPPKGYVCHECLEWIKQEAFEEPLYNDPMPQVVAPQKFWDDISVISIGIFDGELIGIRCAKFKYGCDAVTEMVQGYCYENDNGELIKRATVEDVPETERCACCHLSLWACNALEVLI